MPKSEKKELRKIKDKVIHSANDLKKFLNTNSDAPDEVREKLDEARDDLINAVNKIVEATTL